MLTQNIPEQRNKEGILLINKPTGQTAFSLVRFLRKHLHVRKIGHAGTLDPFATGVMVMLVGKAYTKLSDEFLSQDKEYNARLRLGISTDTYDCDGKITEILEKVPTAEEVEEAIQRFQGWVEQLPPMFSAKKVKGKKLYELARKGEVIERKPVTVWIETKIVAYEYPFLEISVSCSKGTYLRALANDLGSLLECGAHVASLERTRSGCYRIEDCVTLEHLSDPDIDITTFLQEKRPS